MKYFRSVLITIVFFIFGIGSMFLNFILFPLINIFYKSQKKLEICSDIIHMLWHLEVKFMELLRLYKIEIKGDLNIKNKVIVSTHPSFVDVLILIGLIPRTTCFVKKTLTENFILKNIVNSIFISNDLELEELKAQTKKMLDAGFNVIIFPMGTRHRKDEHPKIKKGASLVALNAQKDIVPIKMSTSENFLFINEPFYAVGNRNVIFEIEQMKTIELNNFSSESEIIQKREITKAIEQSLYK